MPDFPNLVALAAALSAGLAAGWVLARRRAANEARLLESQMADALHKARTDSLTGLANRRAYEEQAALQTAISRRYSTPLTLILLDLDRLKAVNDLQGHRAGDDILCRFASILTHNARECDFVARWGGDEFSALLPQTGVAGAQILVGRLLARLADDSPGFTASAGIAALMPGESVEELTNRADLALREAKQSGRGRLAIHDGRQVVQAGIS